MNYLVNCCTVIGVISDGVTKKKIISCSDYKLDESDMTVYVNSKLHNPKNVVSLRINLYFRNYVMIVLPLDMVSFHKDRHGTYSFSFNLNALMDSLSEPGSLYDVHGNTAMVIKKIARRKETISENADTCFAKAN